MIVAASYIYLLTNFVVNLHPSQEIPAGTVPIWSFENMDFHPVGI
jgi:hypothetical protein